MRCSHHGDKDRAIITIDEDCPRPRQRFSAGHELGHWMKDRGQVAFQCQDKTFVKEWSAENPETRANRYASDLLLPGKMFRASASKRPIIFETVKDLSKLFCTSLSLRRGHADQSEEQAPAAVAGSR
jgi:Zn-dependent peptidase ImmA (M78 family)